MRPVIAVPFLFAATTGCADNNKNHGDDDGSAGVVHGGSDVLYGAEVHSWVRVDAEGEVLEVGATMDHAMVHGLVHTGEEDLAGAKHEDEGSPGATVHFPEEVSSTFFHHLDISPFPGGIDGGGAYDVPFFAFHFLSIEHEIHAAVDCVGEAETIEPERIPEDYLYLGPALLTEGGGCVVGDGVHAIDLTMPEHQDPPGEFTFNPVLGYHMGELIYHEPLVGGEFMLAEKDFDFEVRRPEYLGRNTRFPGRFDARFDAEAETWDLVWSEFSPIE